MVGLKSASLVVARLLLIRGVLIEHLFSRFSSFLSQEKQEKQKKTGNISKFYKFNRTKKIFGTLRIPIFGFFFLENVEIQKNARKKSWTFGQKIL